MSTKRPASIGASCKEGGWTCQFCTLENEPRRKRCNACEARRPLHDVSNLPCKADKPSLISPWIRKRRRRRRKSIMQDHEILVDVRLMGTSGWKSLSATKPELCRISLGAPELPKVPIESLVSKTEVDGPNLASAIKSEFLFDQVSECRSMNYVDCSLPRIGQQPEASIRDVDLEAGCLNENICSNFSPFTSQNDSCFVYASQTQLSQIELVSGISRTSTPPGHALARTFARIAASEERICQNDEESLFRLSFSSSQGGSKGPFDDVESAPSESTRNLDFSLPTIPIIRGAVHDTSPHRDPGSNVPDDGHSSLQIDFNGGVNSSRKSRPISVEAGKSAQNVAAIGLSKCLTKDLTTDASRVEGEYFDAFPGCTERMRERKAIAISESYSSTPATPFVARATDDNAGALFVGACTAWTGAAIPGTKRASSTDVAAMESPPHPWMERGTGPRIGFCTAGKRDTIVISEDSLAKATKVLDGSVPTSIHDFDHSSVDYFDTPGMGKARVTFESDVAKVNTVNGGSSSTGMKGVQRAHSGFSTAGKGATISISEESLTKATNLLRGSAPASSTNIISTSYPDSDPARKEIATPAFASVLKTGDLCSTDLDDINRPCLSSSTAGRDVTVAVSGISLANATDSMSAVTPTCGDDFKHAPQTGLRALCREKDAGRPSQSVEMPCRSSLTSLENQNCAHIGFRTAGKRVTIAISDDSLAKATKTLDGLAPISMNDFDPPSVVCFGTPGIGKARVTFEGDMAIDNTVDGGSSSTRIEATNRAHNGFRTAGRGATISISEESLTKATNLLRSSASASSINCISTSDPDSSRAQVMAMSAFNGTSRTAKRKLGGVCLTSLDNVNRPFESLADTTDSMSAVTPTCRDDGKPSLPAATRAPRKENSTAAFNGRPLDSVEMHDGSSSTSLVYTNCALSGFSTAGKSVAIAISEDSVAKASKILVGLTTTSTNDLGSSSAACFGSVDTAKVRLTFESDLAKGSAVHGGATSTRMKSTNHTHGGFSTAGKGANIAISEESLTNAANLLHGSAPASSIYCISISGLDAGPAHKERAISATNCILRTTKTELECSYSTSIDDENHICLDSSTAVRGLAGAVSGECISDATNSMSVVTPSCGNNVNPSSQNGICASRRENGTDAFGGRPSKRVKVLSGSSSPSLVGTESAPIGFITEGTSETNVLSVDSLSASTNGRGLYVSSSTHSRSETIVDAYGVPPTLATTRRDVSSTTLDEAPVCFSTAGRGMPIAISEDSLANATHILRDLAPPSLVDSIPCPVPDPDTFPAAAEMTILPSAENGPSIPNLPCQISYPCAASNPIVLSEKMNNIENHIVQEEMTCKSPTVRFGVDVERRASPPIGWSTETRPLVPFGNVAISLESGLRQKYSKLNWQSESNDGRVSLSMNGIVTTEFESNVGHGDTCVQRSRGIDSIIDIQGDDIRDSLLTPSGETLSSIHYVADLSVAAPHQIQGLNNSRRICHVFGVHSTTMDVNSTNATNLRFHRNTGLPAYFLADQVSSDGIGGADAMRLALSRYSIDAEALSDRWLLNHSRWIIWKLASIERRFPFEAGGKQLSFQRLIGKLKYRYEKEVRCGMRSSIRKVLNKDVSSTTTMILCVSKIHTMGELSTTSSSKPSGSKSLMIELTDGWYGVKAILDEHLKCKVEKSIIQTGTKIAVCSATLIGAGDGIDPLDGSYDSMQPDSPVYLILSSNATRLAARGSRLGFVKPSKRFTANRGDLKCRRLSDIVLGGGVVPCIDLLVCRVYPMLHFERNGLQRNSGSLSSVLTESEEYARRAELEDRRTTAIERAIESFDMECPKNVEDTLPDVWHALQSEDHRADRCPDLSERERRIADKRIWERESLIRNRVHNEVVANLDDVGVTCRESTPFISLFVKSASAGICDGALLTVWNVTESQEAVLKEGEVITFRNLAVKSCRRDGLLQLTARESTPMNETQYDVEEKGSMGFVGRSRVTLFSHHTISRKLSLGLPIPFQRQIIDMAGLVLKVVQCSAHQCKIYLADDSGLVSRIERNCSAAVANAFLSMSENSRGALHSISFRDVRVMPFDYVESCAVAAFTHNSTSSTMNCISDAMAVSANRDDALAELVAAASEAGTSIHAMTSSIRCPVTVAIGRIVGCEENACEPISPFKIQVDCGSTTLHTWELPSVLLEDALMAIGDGWKLASVSSRKSERSGTSSGFKRALMASGVLLRFVLQAKKTSYEVRQLSVAHENAISALHLAVQRKRLA